MSMPSDGGSGADPRWSLRLLGGFELRFRAGERVALPGKRQRLLLAYLALKRSHRQTRTKLTLLLWGDAAGEMTIGNLRTCLWSLRKTLGDTEHRVLASDGEDLVLDASRFDIDAVAFERYSAESGRSSLEAAANLYIGELLDGLDADSEDFEAWRRLEANRYRDRAAKVLLRLMTARSEAGETERAIEAGVQLLRLEPLHEAAARRLMQLYRERGRRGAAVDVYRTLAQTLRRELDAEPEAETRAVFADIGRGIEERSAETREPASPPIGHDAPRTTSLMMRAGTSASAVDQGSSTGAPEPAGSIAVVVLPFTNLSGDPSQEFFSDGVTEEVTTALAKVRSLRVVARTSAFQFKNEGRDVRTVAQMLGASHLVEGAVRRDGKRMRINAQLIEARSGTDLWTQSYDCEFDDLFAVQDDIAEAIAKALQIPLGLQHNQGVTTTHAGDLHTYLKFRLAWAKVHARGYESLADGTRLLEEVVASDRDGAPAWASLAQAYVFGLNFHPAWISGDLETLKPLVARLMPKAEAGAQRAIELDPNLADGYALLGLTLELRGELLQAEDLYRRAMALDPSNPDVLHFYSRLLAEVGRLKESLAMRQQLQEFDPFVPVYNTVTSWLFWLNGETEKAVALSESLPSFERGYSTPIVLASVGRYREAADLIAGNEMALPGVTEAAAGLLRSAPAQVTSPETLPRLGWFNFIYLHVGALERTLEFYEDGVAAGYSVSASNALLWHPSFAELRKTERYKNFLRKRGVVEYWRERGWPELCRPLGPDGA